MPAVKPKIKLVARFDFDPIRLFPDGDTELFESYRQKRCKGFCGHRLHVEARTLNERVAVALVLRFPQRDCV